MIGGNLVPTSFFCAAYCNYYSLPFIGFTGLALGKDVDPSNVVHSTLLPATIATTTAFSSL